MLTLEEIHIYPVKSLPGVRLSKAQVAEKGLLFDRRMMLIDESGRFMTQRTTPAMCMFDVRLAEGIFFVSDRSGKRNDEIQIDLTGKISGSAIKAEIWDDEVEVIEPDMGASAWFSQALGIKCRLVAFPEKNSRRIDPDYSPEEKQVSLADGYPILIISRESLDLLNSKLEQPVGMERFRPNLVFSGGNSHQEDFLKRFRIGNNIFAAVKPCARCVLTTVNPMTGELGIEPLKTLNTYRKQGSKVNFGMNIIPVDYGQIQEGDEIVVV